LTEIHVNCRSLYFHWWFLSCFETLWYFGSSLLQDGASDKKRNGLKTQEPFLVQRWECVDIPRHQMGGFLLNGVVNTLYLQEKRKSNLDTMILARRKQWSGNF
jgi:hypothetical protein